MKRLLVQDAFVGEPDPAQQGLAILGDEDEALMIRVTDGRLVVVVPPGTPDGRVFEQARCLALRLRLEDGRTLDLDVDGDAVGASFSPGRARDGEQDEAEAVGLSSLWASNG